jgi:hemerythrin-like metal-binding protein
MKDIVWGQVLSIEVDEIDEDHRKLIEIFNMLNHAVTDGESPDYLAAILEELVNFTAWHFSHEERLMLKHGYAGLEDHRQEHRELIKSAKALQEKIQAADNTIADEDIEYLEHWVTEHILTDDMKMGDHLSEVM